MLFRRLRPRHVLSLCAVAVAIVSGRPALAQQPITTPILLTDSNFRDLAGIIPAAGGSGFADTAAHGGVMRTGVFYRSEALSMLSAADWATLSSLRIGLDIDLRTPAEINGPITVMAPNAGPDWVPAGARYVNINIFGSSGTPSTASVTTAAAAVSYMEALYQGFVTDPGQRAAFRNVLLTLAGDPSAAALYHCSAGKDRTGWTSMLLQSIAGVSPSTIMTAYLATNIYMAASNQTMLAQIYTAAGGGAAGNAAVAVAAPMFGVQISYLQAGLDQVAAQYGSVYAYLMQGLGLSLADIYVLRAKMVYFASLPGQSGMTGNAAAGAALLGALQNSPLSGRYTSFNYYLQSAIDAGTLGGVETQVGGQIHADTAAFLTHQPLWIDSATAPYASGRDLRGGESRAWLSGLGGYLVSNGGSGVARSTERSAGPLAGVTWRIDGQTSAFVGAGYQGASVSSAGGKADLDLAVATFGGRYGFTGLDVGPYVSARSTLTWAQDRVSRSLGGALGTATGSGSGGVVSGRVDVGNVVRLAPWTITPQLGLRATYVRLGGFGETGSELALAVERTERTLTSVVADLDIALDARAMADWQLSPAITLGYERALSDPRLVSNASLYGYRIAQVSAFDSRDLFRAGLAVAARQNAATLRAGANAIIGDNASTGFDARLSLEVSF